MASANRGTRCLNRCISPLDRMIDDVMHFFVIFFFEVVLSTRLEHFILVYLVCIVVASLKKNLTLGLVVPWNYLFSQRKPCSTAAMVLYVSLWLVALFMFLFWRSVGTNSWSFCGL